MGLFDILDDIAEKQVLKTDTGDTRIFGVVVGRVAKNYDQSMPGRVCVTVPTRDTEANELQWARVAMPSSGLKWGQYFLPEIGDQVLLAFEQGIIEKPYVIGCIPKDNNSFIKRSADADNQYKKIVTRNGNTIYFEDNKEGEGLKDKIRIFTAQESHKVELDNGMNKIVVSDKEGRNMIEMRTDTGLATIKAEKRLTIQVGETITLILNGGNGTIQIKASRLDVDASGNIDLSASGSAKVSAGTVSVDANSLLKLLSSGAVTVSGAPIKLG